MDEAGLRKLLKMMPEGRPQSAVIALRKCAMSVEKLLATLRQWASWLTILTERITSSYSNASSKTRRCLKHWWTVVQLVHHVDVLVVNGEIPKVMRGIDEKLNEGGSNPRFTAGSEPDDPFWRTKTQKRGAECRRWNIDLLREASAQIDRGLGRIASDKKRGRATDLWEERLSLQLQAIIDSEEAVALELDRCAASMQRFLDDPSASVHVKTLTMVAEKLGLRTKALTPGGMLDAMAFLDLTPATALRKMSGADKISEAAKRGDAQEVDEEDDDFAAAKPKKRKRTNIVEDTLYDDVDAAVDVAALKRAAGVDPVALRQKREMFEEEVKGRQVYPQPVPQPAAPAATPAAAAAAAAAPLTRDGAAPPATEASGPKPAAAQRGAPGGDAANEGAPAAAQPWLPGAKYLRQRQKRREALLLKSGAWDLPRAAVEDGPPLRRVRVRQLLPPTQESILVGLKGEGFSTMQQLLPVGWPGEAPPRPVKLTGGPIDALRSLMQRMDDGGRVSADGDDCVGSDAAVELLQSLRETLRRHGLWRSATMRLLHTRLAEGLSLATRARGGRVVYPVRVCDAQLPDEQWDLLLREVEKWALCGDGDASEPYLLDIDVSGSALSEGALQALMRPSLALKCVRRLRMSACGVSIAAALREVPAEVLFRRKAPAGDSRMCVLRRSADAAEGEGEKAGEGDFHVTIPSPLEALDLSYNDP